MISPVRTLAHAGRAASVAALMIAAALVAPAAATASAPDATLTGTLRVAIVDDPAHGTASREFDLQTATGSVHLDWQALAAPAGLRPNARVEVSGARATGSFVVRSARVLAEAGTAGAPGTRAPNTSDAITGPKAIGVVLAQFSDQAGFPVGGSLATAASAFNGNAAGADTVQRFYTESSRGRLSMTATVLGAWTLAIAPTCDLGATNSALTTAATARGVDLSAYQYVVVWTKELASCQFAGIGYLSYGRAWVAVNDARSAVIVTAHELGHNLGLEHAASLTCTSGATTVALSTTCTSDDYGDPFASMGNAWYFEPLHHADNDALLGWLATGEERDIAAAGTYNLVPMYSATAGVRLLRLARAAILPALGKGHWALELRSAPASSEFDNFGATPQTATTGVSIRFVPDSAAWYEVAGMSYLVDTNPATPGNFNDAPLTAGRTFADPVAGITFHVNSVASGLASVDVGDTLAPSAPGSLTAANATAGVRLTWGAATDNLAVGGYQVIRDGMPLTATGPGTLTYTDATAAAGTTYAYAVEALDTANTAGPSVGASITTPGTPVTGLPGVPRTVALAAGAARLTVTWAAPTTDGGSSILDYTATAAPGGATCTTAALTSTLR